MRFFVSAFCLMIPVVGSAWGTSWGESGWADFLQAGQGPLGACLPPQFNGGWESLPTNVQQETLYCLADLSGGGQADLAFADYVENWQGPQNVYTEVAYVYLDTFVYGG